MSFSVKDIRGSDWYREHKKKQYGVVTEDVERYGYTAPELVILRLEDVIGRAGIEEDEDLLVTERDRNIPKTVAGWMEQLGIVSIYSLSKATKQLSRENRLEMLSDWFNGSGGLPVKDARLNLGHPALLEAFLSWLVRYLALHDHVDGRVNRKNEQIINLCRSFEGKGPVRRF